MYPYLSRTLAVVGVMVFAAVLAACSSAKKDEYKNAKSLPPLEVPPDLIHPPKDTTFAVPAAPAAASGKAADESATAAPAQSNAAADVPAPVARRSEAPAAAVSGATAHIEREGAQRWLVVPGDAAAVRTRAREFLQQDGFEIANDDAVHGTIETEWRAAEGGRGDTRDQKELDAALATGLQDKFRVRIEAGRVAGTVEIYVSHLGLQRTTAAGAEKWQPRPADPLLEAELLSRMQDYFSDEAHAEPPADLPAVRADISTGSDSVSIMRIAEDFDRAWRRIGIALGRGGFVIEDRNRNEGVYHIRLGRAFKEDANAGFFSRLFGRNAGDAEAQYRIALNGRGNDTTVVVQHPGGAPVRTSIGERILDRLKEKME